MSRNFVFKCLIMFFVLQNAELENSTQCYLETNSLVQTYNYSDFSMIRVVYRQFKFYSSITIKGRQIRQIPDLIFANFCLNQIDLSENQIDYISNQSFHQLIYLKELILAKNRIWSIESLFKALHVDRLTYLDLSSNLIRSIPTKLSNNIENLETLNLNSNNIKHIDDLAFEMFGKLRNLQLDGNVLKSISDEMFSGLVNLESLSMQHNSIRTIELDAFAQLGRLQSLFLSKNELEQVNESFNRLYGLKNLFLDFNRIAWIHPKAFVQLDQLKELVLKKIF